MIGVDLRVRAQGPELLDLGVPEPEARASLADLRFVNRWLGNRRHVLSAVDPYLVAPRPKVLDVGCGSGDLLSYLQRERPALRPVGADLKALHLREAPPDLARVAADVHALPFPPRSFDVVLASLFLHHFDAAELSAVLGAMAAVSRRAVIVNDLRRARLPYLFGRVAFAWLFRSRVSVEDGLLSIRRGFTEAELEAAFRAVGLAPRIVRTWPYRLLAVAEVG